METAYSFKSEIKGKNLIAVSVIVFIVGVAIIAGLSVFIYKKFSLRKRGIWKLLRI